VDPARKGGTKVSVFALVGILGFIPGITTNYSQMAFAGPDSGAMLLGPGRGGNRDACPGHCSGPPRRSHGRVVCFSCEALSLWTRESLRSKICLTSHSTWPRSLMTN